MNKETKKINKFKTEEQKEIIKFIIILVVVVTLVVGIYFFTKKFVTKDEEKQDNQTVTGTVNYNVTIIGELLNRPYDEYYAIIYDSTSNDAGKYQGIYSKFTTSEKSTTKMYYIDLSNKLNASYYSKDETNPKATSISELKLGDFTLIKVKKGKIVKYLEDEKEVKKELGMQD